MNVEQRRKQFMIARDKMGIAQAKCYKLQEEYEDAKEDKELCEREYSRTYRKLLQAQGIMPKNIKI